MPICQMLKYGNNKDFFVFDTNLFAYFGQTNNSIEYKQ